MATKAEKKPDLEADGRSSRMKAHRSSLDAAMRGAGAGAPGEEAPAPGAPGVTVVEPWNPEALERPCGAVLVGGVKLYAKYGRDVELEGIPMEDEIGAQVAEDLAPVLDYLLPKGQYGELAVHLVSLAANVGTFVSASAMAIKAAERTQSPEPEGADDLEVSESGGIRRKES